MFDIKFPKMNLKLSSRLFRAEEKCKEIEPYILFPDTPAGDKDTPDIFSRGDIATKIAHAIWKSKGQMNFLIAGEWGIGKTSILKLVKTDLRRHGIRSIWFSPWKYTGSMEGPNAISRAFLTKLAERFAKPKDVRDLYLKKEVESERNLVTQLVMLLPLLIRYALYWAVIYFFLQFLINSIPQLKQTINQIDYGRLPIRDQFGLLASMSALLALPPLGEYFIAKIRQRGEVERISSPELMEKTFKSLINESLRVRWLQKILSFWEETMADTFLWFLGKPLTRRVFYDGILRFLKVNKLVVFVDDLDRCGDNEVREFLSGMKTFLEHQKVYYVIAADMEKLRSQADEEEPEFLRKIVQVDWNVPSLSGEQLEFYIKELLDEADAPRNLINVNQVAYLFRNNPNPRRVKYYLRRLLFLLNVVEK